MCRQLLLFLLTIALLNGAQMELFCQPVQAQLTSLEPAAGEQLLVLKNGNIIRGYIEKVAADVVVQTAQGSRLVIAADQADFVCNDLVQAYWGKLARIRAVDTEGQIDLFHWCVQHKLLEQAKNQIDVLQASRMKGTQLDYLNRQLEVALEQQEKAIQPVAKSIDATLSPLPIVIAHTSRVLEPAVQNQLMGEVDFFDVVDPIFAPLPSLNDAIVKSKPESNGLSSPDAEGYVFKSIRSPVDGQASEIIQAGYSQPVEQITDLPEFEAENADDLHEVASGNPPTIATIAELEKTTRSLPKGAVGIYRTQVESVLIHRCTKCHEADSPIMPLMHAGRSQALSRRMSQRNLFSVLQFVDINDPLASRLLSAASTAHGGAPEPDVPLDSPQFANLRKWIVMISRNPDQVTFPAEPIRLDETQIDAGSIKPINPARSELQPAGDSVTNLLPSIGDIPKLNSQLPNFKPLDDFDPEIFNRLYIDQKN